MQRMEAAQVVNTHTLCFYMPNQLNIYSDTRTAAGSIPPGALLVAVLNTGAAAGTFNGVPLPAGASVNIPAPPIDACGNRWTLPRIDYDATGTTFVITALYYPES